MERLSNLFGLKKESGPGFEISLTPDASDHLRRLVTRPNPDWLEFAFLGLGAENLVDQILVANEEDLIGQLTLNRNGIPAPKVSHSELVQLFFRLDEIGRRNDLLLLGHLHPTGAKKVNGQYFWLEPNDESLYPSAGSPNEGGPTAGGDIGFLKSFHDINENIHVPYAGIAAKAGYGHFKLRIYKIEELIKIKRYNDIDSVPQTTIDL